MDNYNKIWSLIRNTDLLNDDEKIELHLYLGNLKEQLKKKDEVIKKTIEFIEKAQLGEFPDGVIYWLKDDEVGKKLLQILEDKEADINVGEAE